MKYLPFLTGIYSVAPGLVPMQKAQAQKDKQVFQIDENYIDYLHNKADCRKENIRKYYTEHAFSPQTAKRVSHYIAAQLQTEYPALFQFSHHNNQYCFTNTQTGETIQWNESAVLINSHPYLSVFDALCSQVPEDIAVCQLEGETDWLSAIHLCSPNHWSPEEKIGKPFSVVHAPVAGMQKTSAHAFKMLQSVVEKSPFTRFAWGVSTDTKLNHHPESGGADEPNRQVRKIESGMPLFIRAERQNLIGFPDVNAFLFTIRTYFYPVSELNNSETKALLSAIKSMSAESLAYKGMTGALEVLEKLMLQSSAL